MLQITMSDDIQLEEPMVGEPTEDTTNAPKKAVKFDANELTFDEAQAEIDAIKARAGQARESLKSVPVASSSYSTNTSTTVCSYDDDVPKSKNMLSHLNSNSAMINYKVTTARNLVQKQEALLRNLKMMRENMERSSVEISRASDYFSPIKVQPRGYFEKRAESAPLISRRHQVRELSPLATPSVNPVITESRDPSERAYSPTPLSISTHVSSVPAPVSPADYQPDAEFEQEMAAIRRRVANLSKQANEIPKPRYSSYDYDSELSSGYPGGYNSLYTPLEPKIEVKSNRSHRAPVSRMRHVSLPSKTIHSSKHVPDDYGITYPRNTYSEYLLDTVNSLDPYPTSSSDSLDLHGLHANPLAATDLPMAY